MNVKQIFAAQFELTSSGKRAAPASASAGFDAVSGHLDGSRLVQKEDLERVLRDVREAVARVTQDV